MNLENIIFLTACELLVKLLHPYIKQFWKLLATLPATEVSSFR